MPSDKLIVQTDVNSFYFLINKDFFFISIKQIDAVLRTSSISTNYVGIDSITASLNSDGIIVLEYMLHVIPNAGYSVQVIEQSFEDNLMGTDGDEFMEGNKVVNASFVIGK